MEALTAQQKIKAMEEELNKLREENSTLRDAAADKIEKDDLDKKIEQLNEELATITEQRRKRVEVEKLEKQVYDAKTADKSKSMSDSAVQYPIEALPEDDGKLKVQIKEHTERQLAGRTLTGAEKTILNRYVDALTQFISAYRLEKDHWNFKNSRLGMSENTMRAGDDARWLAEYRLHVKPIIDFNNYMKK